MSEYINRKRVGSVLSSVIRILILVAIISLVDVIGLWFFLHSRGQWNPYSFRELLSILLLLEGALIGAAGGFMFLGFSEYGVARQAAINPAIARDQLAGWKERRLSQQKWGIAMLVVGALLILLFLLVGFTIPL